MEMERKSTQTTEYPKKESKTGKRTKPPLSPQNKNSKGKKQMIAGKILSIRDISRLFCIVVISFCAVFVCTLFLNYNTDLKSIGIQVMQSDVQNFYNAQVMTGKIVSILSGGCLLSTSAVMLCFYIGHYVDTHAKMLGILKAMGYPNLKIAKGFAGFGLCVFVGTAAGYAMAHSIMPLFYRTQNADGLLPEISIHFHPALSACLILLPTLAFCLLSVLYGYFRLKTPVLDLLKGEASKKIKIPKDKKSRNNIKKLRTIKNTAGLPFLQEQKKSILRQKKSLVFFIGFASFCYASMMQMSFGMEELASRMMALMIFLIGFTLSFVMLFLATTSTVKSNWKTLALMRAFGYSDKECSNSILSGYRLPAYVGFAIGTVYQYTLLKIAVTVIFAEIENVPEFHFDIPAFLITLVSFAALYQLILYIYARKIKQMSIREVMMGEE